MVTLRIIPVAPTRTTSRAAASAKPAPWLERHVKAEPHQRRVFSVEEGQAMLSRRNCKPNAGPNSSAILYPGPILWPSNPVEALPSLPVHSEGKDALLFSLPSVLRLRYVPSVLRAAFRAGWDSLVNHQIP